MEANDNGQAVQAGDLLACPFCGGPASPVIIFASSVKHDPDAAFWGDREKVAECRRAGCRKCGCDMDADKWQRRANAPHQARAVASRPECGCSTGGDA